MSWMKALYDTYNVNSDLIGVEQARGERRFSLLPISHTTQTAHIEVTITEEGEFHSATVLDKKITLIPTTESSASRSGAKIAPYPLHDKLGYVAGDFKKYGGGEKEEKQFDAYIKQLKHWAESSYTHPKIQTIYHYLSKKQLIQDLVESKLFILDNEQLLLKWQANLEKTFGNKPEIFNKVTGDLTGAFIRFNVHSAEEILTPVWEDRAVQQSFVDFYNDLLQENDVCYITGKMMPATERHANKIRNAADKAKLISSNDTSGFTFRGRFDKSNEAFAIGYDVSQKAHNALKWLINLQGKVIDERVFLVWGNTSKVDVLSPDEDSFSMLRRSKKIETKSNPNTFESFAKEVSNAIEGLKNDLEFKAEVNILVLDAATPGRLSVQYYRNFNKEIYFERLKKWHQSCVWVHSYKKENDNYVTFTGAPATRDIASAAYGSKANDRIIKDTIERLLPCILDGQRIPKDLIRTLAHRASTPVSMEFWEWQKTLSIACALINREEEEFNVGLDKESTDRSYLFGRLLGVAYELERKALWSKGEKRETSAERFMTSFSNSPKRTWGTIHESLLPYKMQSKTKANWLYDQIITITDQFKIEDFNDKPLDPVYLLGFSSQIMELRNSNNKNEEKEENEE